MRSFTLCGAAVLALIPMVVLVVFYNKAVCSLAFVAARSAGFITDNVENVISFPALFTADYALVPMLFIVEFRLC